MTNLSIAVSKIDGMSRPSLLLLSRDSAADDRLAGVLLATYGQIYCPPLARSRWPLTHRCKTPSSRACSTSCWQTAAWPAALNPTGNPA